MGEPKPHIHPGVSGDERSHSIHRGARFALIRGARRFACASEAAGQSALKMKSIRTFSLPTGYRVARAEAFQIGHGVVERRVLHAFSSPSSARRIRFSAAIFASTSDSWRAAPAQTLSHELLGLINSRISSSVKPSAWACLMKRRPSSASSGKTRTWL